MASARFNTAEYYRAHLKEPRGTGCWAFAPDNGDWMLSPCLTFAEAKKWAREQNPAAKEFLVGP